MSSLARIIFFLFKNWWKSQPVFRSGSIPYTANLQIAFPYIDFNPLKADFLSHLHSVLTYSHETLESMYLNIYASYRYAQSIWL